MSDRGADRGASLTGDRQLTDRYHINKHLKTQTQLKH